MTFKQAALKLLSCGLRTREDEDRVEVAEAIAWSIWALMEQARYDGVDVSDVDLNTGNLHSDILSVGDRVKYSGDYHLDDPEYYPSPGTVGEVDRISDTGAWVQWPAGSTSGDDLWHVRLEDITLAKIP